MSKKKSEYDHSSRPKFAVMGKKVAQMQRNAVYDAPSREPCVYVPGELRHSAAYMDAVPVEVEGEQYNIAVLTCPPQIKGMPTIIYFGGSDFSHKNYQHRIKALIDKGFGVVVPTYPGFPGAQNTRTYTTGSPSEPACYNTAEAVIRQFRTQGFATADSGKKFTAEGQKIIVHGFSLGGPLAVYLAGTEEKIDGLSLEDPPASILKASKEGISAFLRPLANLFFTERFDAVADIPGVAEKNPAILVHIVVADQPRVKGKEERRLLRKEAKALSKKADKISEKIREAVTLFRERKHEIDTLKLQAEEDFLRIRQENENFYKQINNEILNRNGGDITDLLEKIVDEEVRMKKHLFCQNDREQQEHLREKIKMLSEDNARKRAMLLEDLHEKKITVAQLIENHPQGKEWQNYEIEAVADYYYACKVKQLEDSCGLTALRAQRKALFEEAFDKKSSTEKSFKESGHTWKLRDAFEQHGVKPQIYLAPARHLEVWNTHFYNESWDELTYRITGKKIEEHQKEQQIEREKSSQPAPELLLKTDTPSALLTEQKQEIVVSLPPSLQEIPPSAPATPLPAQATPQKATEKPSPRHYVDNFDKALEKRGKWRAERDRTRSFILKQIDAQGENLDIEHMVHSLTLTHSPKVSKAEANAALISAVKELVHHRAEVKEFLSQQQGREGLQRSRG